MLLKLASFVSLAVSSCCLAQVTYPTYPYFVPAIAQGGGPAYVIAGTVTEKTTIGFSLTGQSCEQTAGTACYNAAGVVTVKGSTSKTGVGDATTFTATVGGFSGQYNFGSLLMSIEGVGTVQVFPASKASGLHSVSPKTDFTLAPTPFSSLGFKSFKKQNPKITFYVADNYYPDNAQGFWLYLHSPTITYDATIPSRKIIQVNGPCDWAIWDLGNGPCFPTAASASKSEVLGNDEGNSFVDTSTGKVIYLFGDTIGVKLPMTSPGLKTNTYPKFKAADAIATAPMPTDPADFTLDFFPKSPMTPQFVTPTPQPGKPPIPVVMGGNDVPASGIHVNGKNFILIHTGSNTSLKANQQTDYSVLVEDDGNTKFTSGRTISTANVSNAPKPGYTQTGHFTLATFAQLPLAYAQQIGLTTPAVLIAGEGEYRSESIYLAYIPNSSMSLTVTNNDAMRYFTGLDANGAPQWSKTEMDAVPVIVDNPTGLPATPDPGTVGDASLRYFPELGMWLMTWDGGRQSTDTTGIYFSAASAPWGPWSTPELIYNACTAHRYGEGYGDFIHYVAGKNDICGGEVDDGAGPAGPIIGTSDGDPFLGVANKTETALNRQGGIYAPYMVPGLTTVNGSELTVDYNMSTWNPYAVVLMESKFKVTPQPF